MKLRADVVSTPGVVAKKSLVFLHGILGSGGNLRTLAKRLVEARPAWQAVLMDLRAHGHSEGTGGEDTVQGAARDVEETAAQLTAPMRAVLGHSFGGKVALFMEQAPLEHVVLVDSSPSARRDFRGSESTIDVVTHLGTMSGPWTRREDFVAELQTAGFTRELGLWLAMNLRRDGEVFHFGLDLARINALLESYFTSDAWPVLEAPTGPKVHLVIGERSRVFSEEERVRARALMARGRVTVDVLPAGHWVHVDDFEGLLAALLRHIA